MITLTRQQRMATLYGEAFAAAGAILLDRMGQRDTAIAVGSIALAAGLITTMLLLHEDPDPPADVMRGVLTYAVWEMTFGAMR